MSSCGSPCSDDNVAKFSTMELNDDNDNNTMPSNIQPEPCKVVALITFSEAAGRAAMLKALENPETGLACTRRAPGCIDCQLYTPLEDDKVLVINATWRTKADHDAYVSFRTETGFFAKFGPSFAAPPQIVQSRVVEALTGPANTYTEEEELASWEDVKKAGWPVLNCFKMPQFTPKLLVTWLKKELEVVSGKLQNVSPIEKECIFAVVSASNACELCSAFHSAGLAAPNAAWGQTWDAVPMDDVTEIMLGGLPREETGLRGVAIAAKWCCAHKGVMLTHEKQLLKEQYNITREKLFEILYCVGQIEGNNRMMINLIAEGMVVDEMLQGMTPFAETAYKNTKAEL